MARRGLAVWVGALALLCARPASALTRQELVAISNTRVLHLSVRDALGEEQGSGSGFLISTDGRVVTNEHVVSGAENIVAVFHDKHEVRVTGTWVFDADVDLAVLQLAPGVYEKLELAPDTAQEGEEIFVIGSPLGLGNSISTGIVSAVRSQGIVGNQFDDGAKSWTLQFTAAAAPGSSGSPILRSDGTVVGVLVGHLSEMDGAHFGIGVERLRPLLTKASVTVRPLNAASGVRTVRSNLMISGAAFLGVAVLWVVGSKMFNKPKPRRAN